MSNKDFFTSVPFSGQQGRGHPTDQENVASFAHAIAARFGSADLLTARILPDEQQQQHSQNFILPPKPTLPPSSKPVPSSSSSSTFTPLNPSDLAPYLADPSTLILDIRPHAAHTAARIHRALSLSIPSTLIKRPLFGLSKLIQMLPSSSARAKFAAWPTANHILVYDADSALVPETSNIAGLLRKFRAEGYTGELAWVKGGFQAVWRDARNCATTDHPSPDEDDPDGTPSSGALRTKHLPKAAFSLSTTTASNAASGTPAIANAANPFFDTIRQNLELSHGITERIPLRLPRRVRRRIKDLPFLWLQDIAGRSALRPSRSSSFPGETSVESGSESSDDPHDSDPDSNDPDVEEGAETLAMQFYRIELAEQRRLRSVMEHHARESEVSVYALGEGGQGIAGARSATATGVKTLPSTPVQGAFPFSITAGVEKGAKNRYNHIWPFEHARVRLHDVRHRGSYPGYSPKRDKDDKKKVASVGPAGGPTGPESSVTFASSSESQLALPSATPSPNVPEEDRNMLMGVDRNLTCTSSSSGMPPPSFGLMTPSYSQSVFHTPLSMPVTPFGPPSSTLTRGGIPMTSLHSFPRSSGGGGRDAYFPVVPHLETSHFPPIPEDAQLSPPRLDTRAQQRSGGFLSPPSLSTLPRSPQSAGPKTVSPLIIPSYTPPASQREMFNLTLPCGYISQGTISATSTIFPQFNMTVVPPKDTPRDPSPVDDYVNASYVQPLGTRKRYIATQGPLPATFIDFWTLVWEQNVHVIVMLTREIENAMVKCGTYWVEPSYGPLQLQLLDTSPPISPSVPSNSSADIGFFMSPRERDKSSKQPSIVVRTFALSHRGYPAIPPRKVTHLQYLDWPDMNVPDDPRGVLELVKRVERAVQESTPGPSPTGSHSNSGSFSGSSGSPGWSFDFSSRGEDFFSSPPLGDARKKHGRKGWRHPDLDSKTGIAAFALGSPPPVLLHCSAGVGRTGGFIAIDAVLDAIKRELMQRRETRARAQARASVVVGADRQGSESVVLESGSGTDMVMNQVKEKENPKGEKIVGTVPLVMGDRKKSRRHHPHKSTVKEGETSSSESLVVHVPFTEETAGLDTRWQNMSSSTREWAEQVLDHTRPGEEEQEAGLPPPLPLSMSLSLPTPCRQGSPGSASNSSGPSALNSADDSVGSNSGSGIGVDVKAGSGRSGSGSGSSGRSSVSGSGSGGAFPPSSCVSISVSHSGSPSNSGVDSISACNSGSGTNTSNSGFWSSTGGDSGLAGFMRARLRDSSATSLSNMSSDFSSEKLPRSLAQPSAVRISPEEEDAMDVDRPPRSSSAPLQPAKSDVISNESNASQANNFNLRPRVRQIIGSSPIASFSTPAFPTTSGTGGDPFFEGEDPVSRTSSAPSSDELLSPPRSFESGGNADVEAASGKSSLLSSDESEDVVLSRKAESRLKATETTSADSAAPGQEMIIKSANTPKEHKPINKTQPPVAQVAAAPSTMPPVPQFVEEKIPDAEQASSELDQRTAGHTVIDYKLPRQLHQDLSPAPLMSHTNPIWTVVQDMREQRMSLCQSLRQYVFVHAAVIEGALMIMDEERVLWGEFTESEGSPASTPSKNSGNVEIPSVGRIQCSQDRTRSFPAGMQSSASSSQVHHTSSPSKWKRGPSPTELLREDKSFAKRPSIKRRTLSDERILPVFELATGAPQVLPSGTGGVSKVESGNTDMGPMTPEWSTAAK